MQWRTVSCRFPWCCKSVNIASAVMPAHTDDEQEATRTTTSPVTVAIYREGTCSLRGTWQGACQDSTARHRQPAACPGPHAPPLTSTQNQDVTHSPQPPTPTAAHSYLALQLTQPAQHHLHYLQPECPHSVSSSLQSTSISEPLPAARAALEPCNLSTVNHSSTARRHMLLHSSMGLCRRLQHTIALLPCAMPAAAI
jgi:hypothetical protein